MYISICIVPGNSDFKCFDTPVEVDVLWFLYRYSEQTVLVTELLFSFTVMHILIQQLTLRFVRVSPTQLEVYQDLFRTWLCENRKVKSSATIAQWCKCPAGA